MVLGEHHRLYRVGRLDRISRQQWNPNCGAYRSGIGYLYVGLLQRRRHFADDVSNAFSYGGACTGRRWRRWRRILAAHDAAWIAMPVGSSCLTVSTRATRSTRWPRQSLDFAARVGVYVDGGISGHAERIVLTAHSLRRI